MELRTLPICMFDMYHCDIVAGSSAASSQITFLYCLSGGDAATCDAIRGERMLVVEMGEMERLCKQMCVHQNMQACMTRAQKQAFLCDGQLLLAFMGESSPRAHMQTHWATGCTEQVLIGPPC